MNNRNENTTTPYDDVHRTMLNDCPKLIIPVVNEMFHKRHSNTEDVKVLNNQFFINKQNGKQIERITDTHFLIGSIRYHLECQSTPDGTMMYRIFEYDSQRLKELTAVYEKIAVELNKCEEKHLIDAYTKSMIVDMSKKVLEHLAMKYSNVKKGVGDIMGGKILEYPTKTAWRQGMQEGMQEGMQQGKQQSILELLQDIGIVSEELQNRISSELDLEVLKKWLKIAAKAESIEEFIEQCDIQ